MSNGYPKLRPRHMGIMQWILENPCGTLTECSKQTGYSRSWVSRIVNSPAFKEDLNIRLNSILKEQIIKSLSLDPSSKSDKL